MPPKTKPQQHREHKHWGWCHRFIDALFFLQDNHCRGASESEEKHGGVWKAIAAAWKGTPS